jgi:hypothetical protein
MHLILPVSLSRMLLIFLHIPLSRVTYFHYTVILAIRLDNAIFSIMIDVPGD